MVERFIVPIDETGHIELIPSKTDIRILIRSTRSSEPLEFFLQETQRNHLVDVLKTCAVRPGIIEFSQDDHESDFGSEEEKNLHYREMFERGETEG